MLFIFGDLRTEELDKSREYDIPLKPFEIKTLIYDGECIKETNILEEPL